MSSREKRTVHLAALAMGIYLVLFVGWTGCKQLEAKLSEYERLLTEAQSLQRELQPYENKVLLAQKLKEAFRLNPHKLSRTTLAAEASAAIQQAAASGGVQVGPLRETSARSSTKELVSMQFEGVGPVPAVMSLLHRLENLGYPLILDSIQINPDTTKPGTVKINLIIVILDFEQWKKEAGPNV